MTENTTDKPCTIDDLAPGDVVRSADLRGDTDLELNREYHIKDVSGSRVFLNELTEGFYPDYFTLVRKANAATTAPTFDLVKYALADHLIGADLWDAARDVCIALGIPDHPVEPELKRIAIDSNGVAWQHLDSPKDAWYQCGGLVETWADLCANGPMRVLPPLKEEK